MKISKNQLIMIALAVYLCNIGILAVADSCNTKSANEPNKPTCTKSLACKYVASKQSNVFHLPACSTAKSINQENLMKFATSDEVKKAGLKPCTLCKPIKNKLEEKQMVYEISRLAGPITIDANWNKGVWTSVKPLELKNYIISKGPPEHFPKTQAKLAYDDEAIYVIWKVDDQYIRAIAETYHGKVSKDSCVEFFFIPNDDPNGGFFNFESNCGTTMLFMYREPPKNERITLPIKQCKQVTIAGTLQKIIEPEITEPTTWYLEYRVPFSILEKYTKVTRPAPGVIWRGNFSKCGAWTSHPHWLNWAPINHPNPKYALPQFFQTIKFK